MSPEDLRELRSNLENDYVLIKKGKIFHFIGGMVTFLFFAGIVSYTATLKAFQDKKVTSAMKVIKSSRDEATKILSELKSEVIQVKDTKVGIGTVQPAAALHVQGETGAIFAFSRESTRLDIVPEDAGGEVGLRYRATSGKAPDLVFKNDAGVERVRITDAGNVGIGTNNPKFKLHVAGIVRANNIQNGSSREYKENIMDLSAQEALETLSNLNPVSFHYKAEKEKDLHLGFIAEDVPDLVATPDRKGLSAMDIVAVLAKVVQHQQTVLQAQKAKFEALEMAFQQLSQ